MSEFELSDEIVQLRAAASLFASERLAPEARAAEAAGAWPEDVRGVLDGFGLRGADLPEELGGAGAGCLAKAVLLETLAGGDAGGLPAADAGGPVAGALLACPDRALAREVATTCLAGDANAVLVVADDEAPGPLRVEWAPSWPRLRWVWRSRGEELALLELVDAPDPTPALAFQASGGVGACLDSARTLGEWKLEAGTGIALRGRARLWSGAVAIGVSQAAWDATIAYARERIVFGKPVAHHQGNAFELAVAATNLHAARLQVRHAAAAYDDADPNAGFWATQAWLTAIDAGVVLTDLGIQMLGGHGFLCDYPAEKRFRELRMLALLAGGRDAAEADSAAQVLDLPDPLFGPGEAAT